MSYPFYNPGAFPPPPPTHTPNGRAYRDPNNLGNSVVLERDRDRLSWKSLIRSRICEDDGLCGVQTVQLFVVPDEEKFDPNAYQGNYRNNLIARVNLGRGGGPAYVDMDLRLGVQASFISESLQVDVRFLEIDEDTPTRVRVTGSVTQASPRASRSFVTRSYPRATLDPGETENFPVPPFAYALSLYSSDQSFYAPGNATITFSGANISTAYAGGQDLYQISGNVINDAVLTEGIKFPNATRVVSVTNNSGAPFNVSAMFALNV
jgi:hypothetical protein